MVIVVVTFISEMEVVFSTISCSIQYLVYAFILGEQYSSNIVR